MVIHKIFPMRMDFIICIEIKISFQNSDSINFKQVSTIKIGLILVNGIKITKGTYFGMKGAQPLQRKSTSNARHFFTMMHILLIIKPRQIHYPSLVAAGASFIFLALS